MYDQPWPFLLASAQGQFITTAWASCCARVPGGNPRHSAERLLCSFYMSTGFESDWEVITRNWTRKLEQGWKTSGLTWGVLNPIHAYIPLILHPVLNELQILLHIKGMPTPRTVGSTISPPKLTQKQLKELFLIASIVLNSLQHKKVYETVR